MLYNFIRYLFKPVLNYTDGFVMLCIFPLLKEDTWGIWLFLSITWAIFSAYMQVDYFKYEVNSVEKEKSLESTT